MGTCVETLISAIKADAWASASDTGELKTAAVAESANGMLAALAGVPRPALQAVFGKDLGRRVWEQTRQAASDGIADEEILGGMIEYVSRRAAEALRANGRQAKAIGLRLLYADGVATLYRTRLPRPTNDGIEIREAAMDLFGQAQARGATVEAVDLKVTSVQAVGVTRRSRGLDFAMMDAVAGVRA